MNIEQKLEELKDVRRAVLVLKAEKSAILDAVKASTRYIAADQGEKLGLEVASTIEEEIRALGLAEYEEFGNKKPHPKVTVKIFKWFKIVEPEKVRIWAFGNLPAALRLDEKKIEKYATEFGSVEGTESGDEPRVQIATEL